ncbi:hypothetical protein FW778_04140 [Ginsengibacter hankyongi]|uniref:Uncharacterized protein n=1 Tax=Ginsengibacter hankyongi TaxID=2607284 RepID=A0A5J5ILJ7_9BACT|nr:hypothetical protein [Ginsengibacter hankyongi]KAA9041233.1 hypothetical protein FW778_04140 [Ginsengibacter hankyongi]
MIVLPNIDILELCFNFKNISAHKKVFDIVYNGTNEICFSKKYIAFLEQSISDTALFEALITELSDTGRLRIETTTEKNNLREEFIEIATKSNISVLIPVVYDDVTNLQRKIPALLIVNKGAPVNMHWIKLELLSNHKCNVSYQQFNSNAEIETLFSNLFAIPKIITDVYVFNRQQETRFLSNVSGLAINYYTFLYRGSKMNEHELLPPKRDLKKILGNRLKLFYTGNARLIHERKIIFDELLITIDNSFENVVINEPTWEINVSYDRQKATKWKSKCANFREVRGN